MGDNGIFIGAASGGGNPQQLELSRANRHGALLFVAARDLVVHRRDATIRIIRVRP